MKLLPASYSFPVLLRPVAKAGFLLVVLLALAASRPAPGYRGDAASKVDFTFSGAGHHAEQVHLRDVNPEVTAPYACFYHDGIMFALQGPVVELRTSKQGPKIWSFHLLLKGSPTTASLSVDGSQPALVYNGGETSQQAFFPQIILPPLRQGTLAAKFLPAPKGRLRGTFSGTLVTDKGEFVTVSNGSFDLPRRPDLN
jgi:hypothetical protein